MAHTTKSQRKRIVVQEVQEVETFHNFRMPPFKACNHRQKFLFNAARTSPFVIATGPAGTGKSYVGAHAALQLYFEGKIDTIILTRNPLPTGTSLGFFAGSESEKMAVWLGPVIGTFKKLLRTKTGSDAHFNYLVGKKFIQYQPLETIKGSSFDRTFIFVEESQELSMEQLKTLTTRIGEDSVLFLNGDVAQGNSRNRNERGYREFVAMVVKENEHSEQVKAQDPTHWDATIIPVIEFTADEIVRSGITRKVVSMFERHGV